MSVSAAMGVEGVVWGVGCTVDFFFLLSLSFLAAADAEPEEGLDEEEEALLPCC